MATAVDIGLPTNIHPMDKMDVGKRLALAARHVAYGGGVGVLGADTRSVTRDGAGLRGKLQGDGKRARDWAIALGGTGATALPTDRLVGFEVAGADGKWQPAEARIDGDAVVISSSAVPKPVAARYDWRAYPEGNLYNKEGLPAPPFQGKAE